MNNNATRSPIWEDGKLIWLDDTDFTKSHKELSYNDLLEVIKGLEEKTEKEREHSKMLSELLEIEKSYRKDKL